MPFNYVNYMFQYGSCIWARTPGAYCQTDTNASDYGQCYGACPPMFFVQTDTTNYPTLPCQSSNTCIRLTSLYGNYQIATVIDLSSVGKQAILKWFQSTANSSLTIDPNYTYFQGFIVPFVGDHPPFSHFGYVNFQNQFLGYDPVYNLWIYVNRYTPKVGYANELQFNDTVLATKITLNTNFGYQNNVYLAGRVKIGVLQEVSPLAIIPLDYNEYLKYNELRRTFGYSADGINQPGWNADDIINVLKELFPDRAWMVYDDKDSTLYLWNVDFSDVPEWLLEKIDPTAVKVLKSPPSPEPEKSLFTELEKRNYVGETA